jgi:hypothetical protein
VEAGTDISAGTTIYAGQSITAVNSIHANTYIQIHGDLSANTLAYAGSGGTICASGQILVSAITSQKIGTSGPSTVYLNPALGQVFYIDFSGSGSIGPVTIDLSSSIIIPNYRGATIYLTLLNDSTTSSITVGFATPNFRSNGNFTINNTGGTNLVTIPFYCNGINSFVEIGQTYVNNG